jgi:hypothetical protein
LPRKNSLLPFKIINAGDLSQSSITSAVTNIQFLDDINIQYIWSAGSSPVGTIAVQVSSNYAQDSQGNVSNSGTWTSLSLSSTPSISGNSGSGVIEMTQLGSVWIRTVYTRTSGSGTLNAYISGKEI